MAPGPSEVEGPDPLAHLTHPKRKSRMMLQTPLRPDAWVSYNQRRDSYLTTQEAASRLGEWIDQANPYLKFKKAYPTSDTLRRWCKRDWFGPLPDGRSGQGRGNGYRLPPVYEYVARVWALTTDVDVRTAAIQAILEVGARDWIVVVANVGSLHYSVEAASERIEQSLDKVQQYASPLHVLHIGPVDHR